MGDLTTLAAIRND